MAWANRIDTFGNSWKTGLFGVINCYQASSGQILCQNTYSFHLNYSMYKEKTQHFYFKLSFSTSPFFAGLLTLLPLPLEEFFGSTFFRVIEVFSHPTVFLVDFRNDTIGQNLNNDILSDWCFPKERYRVLLVILTQFTHRGPIARIKDHLLQHFIRYSQSSFPIYDVFHSARCKAHRRVGNSVCDYFLTIVAWILLFV